MTGQAVFEQRIDPIIGRQVLIAENRAGRPNDFVRTESSSINRSADSTCPFCVGHEYLTPELVHEAVGADGLWQIRVVPNKYPVVVIEPTDSSLSNASVLDTLPLAAVGAHEVFIESPRHIRDITELSIEELALVLRVYRDRLRHWSYQPNIEYTSIFKNVGVAAGASLEHIHSQLIALPDMSPVVASEFRSCQQYFAANKTCLFCRLIRDELEHRQRLVIEDDEFIAFCAFAGRQPYETWVMLQEHSPRFELLSDRQAESLARILFQLVQGLRSQLPELAYNLILHTAPFKHDSSDQYHWHFELVPRSTRLAGFEWGTGLHINPLAPERAAARLRESCRGAADCEQ